MWRPTTVSASKLLHNGVLAFSQIESNGFRIDVPYLDGEIVRTDEKIRKLKADLRVSPEGQLMRKRFGIKASLGSTDQISKVLFDDMKLPPPVRTANGKYQLDAAVLGRIGSDFTKALLKLGKYEKLNGTFLRGLRAEVEGDLLHAFFNLTTTLTHRSSSDSVNFQNQPIRDRMQGRSIRTAFIPREGRWIVESDYSGIEVHAAAWYHQDPTMLQYLIDNHDMHGDMAAEIFMLPKDSIPKPVRQTAKNKFVFAEFYGDFWWSCAAGLWADAASLTTADGVPMYEHLASKGITGFGEMKRDDKGDPAPGTFQAHILEVESNFWGVRFPVYDQWRRNWYQNYKRCGGFRTLTGFWIDGLYRRNNVINYPVQGTAFHCLLWSLIRLQKEIKDRGMKTLIIGQIHDSILSDVPENELAMYQRLINRIMTEDILEEFKFICTPLKIEIEGSDKNWWEKKVLGV